MSDSERMSDRELLGRIDERTASLDRRLYGTDGNSGDIGEIKVELKRNNDGLQAQGQRICRMERIWNTIWNGLKSGLTLLIGGGGLLAIILKAVGVY